MLFFDSPTLEKLKSPKAKIGDKLFLIARYIEEKYQFINQPNHWEDVFDSMDDLDKIFYKTWLWMCYAEWENLDQPIEEFDKVFGIEERERLVIYLKSRNDELGDLETFYTLDGEAGKKLLSWAMENFNIE